MLSDMAEPPLAKGNGFFKVAEAIDQLDDDGWDSEDDLPADFVVANNPFTDHETLEITPRICNTVADNPFSANVTGETVIDVPHAPISRTWDSRRSWMLQTSVSSREGLGGHVLRCRVPHPRTRWSRDRRRALECE